MPFAIKRIHNPPSKSDGHRVLVDRLWPRGVSRAAAHLDEWLKDAAPSTELRRWFHEDRERWPAFRARYLAELEDRTEMLHPLLVRAKKGRVTLLYAARDTERNHALVLLEFLKSLAKASPTD